MPLDIGICLCDLTPHVCDLFCECDKDCEDYEDDFPYFLPDYPNQKFLFFFFFFYLYLIIVIFICMLIFFLYQQKNNNKLFFFYLKENNPV